MFFELFVEVEDREWQKHDHDENEVFPIVAPVHIIIEYVVDGLEDSVVD
jgi:hypothetical protein